MSRSRVCLTRVQNSSRLLASRTALVATAIILSGLKGWAILRSSVRASIFLWMASFLMMKLFSAMPSPIRVPRRSSFMMLDELATRSLMELEPMSMMAIVLDMMVYNSKFLGAMRMTNSPFWLWVVNS